MSSRLARINADYLQARRDLAAGVICHADYDKAEQILDQALNNAPKEK